MNTIRQIIKKYSQFIKFSIVGVMNTTISLIVYYILLFFGMHFLIANAIGYLVGIINGFILSSKFVFKTDMNINSGSKFVLTYVSSFIIGSTILYFLVEILLVPETIAPLIISIFNVIYNYIINKVWTFNK